MKAIEVKHLNVYYGQNQALKDVNLIVEKGSFLGIIGPNGGGKSTLLKAILGLLPYQGDIKILDQSQEKIQGKIGYVPQVAEIEKKFPITVIDVVKAAFLKKGMHPFLRFTKKDDQKAMEKLTETGIEDLAQRQVSELSGGEFQRMLIARALAVEPDVLLLDEPVASVDPGTRTEIYKLLTKINQEQHKTILMVTHDVMAIASTVTRIVCLNQGVVYHGEPELNEEILEHLYGCPVDLIAHGVPHRVLPEHKRGV